MHHHERSPAAANYGASGYDLAGASICPESNDCRPFVQVGSAFRRQLALLDPRNHKERNQRELKAASLDPAIVAAVNVDGLR